MNDIKPIIVGCLYPNCGTAYRYNIYDTSSISNTFTARGANNNIMILEDLDKDKIISVGNINPSNRGMGGEVLYEGGVFRTVPASKSDQRYICVAERGRNVDNLNDRTPGLSVEQRLEPKLDGTTNALTSVNKDNLVLIRQATKQGYIECEIDGVADLSYPTSNERRGRVIDRGTVSPTIQTSSPDIAKIERYRIRRLTPLECYRLMGVSDEDANKMISVNSETQCYKQAGNSIVVDVMTAMFKNLFEVG